MHTQQNTDGSVLPDIHELPTPYRSGQVTSQDRPWCPTCTQHFQVAIPWPCSWTTPDQALQVPPVRDLLWHLSRYPRAADEFVTPGELYRDSMHCPYYHCEVWNGLLVCDDATDALAELYDGNSLNRRFRLTRRGVTVAETIPADPLTNHGNT